MDLPLVSVCVPIYGTEKTILKCFQSIISQTYVNIEMVFVNDCTKDNAIEVLSQAISEEGVNIRAKIINHDNNRGLAASRITAILHAQGDYIFFLDSDDFLPDYAISKLVSKALECNADIVVGNMMFDSVTGKSTLFKIPIFRSKEEYVLNLLSIDKVRVVSVCGKLYKKKLFNDDYYFVEGLNDGEDYSVSPRVSDKADIIAFIDDAVYNYIVDNNSSMSNSRSWRVIEDMTKAFSILSSYFEKRGTEYHDAILRGKAFVVRINYYYLPRKSGKRLQQHFPELRKKLKGESLSQYFERKLIFNDCRLTAKVINKIRRYFN